MMNGGASIEGGKKMKRKVVKWRRPRGLRTFAKSIAKSVSEYLVSDNYMYASLIDDSFCNRISPDENTSFSPLSTGEINKAHSKVSSKRISFEEFMVEQNPQ